ncbi:O-antigen ligase family protein [Terrimonas pollutisoli]|uniref:O-antigen ligase family protein n=1 Tax=Terrimonas pollutisoli TaxID=3034147 RepID=UPI0023EB1239|nr:O-antigen ligase family protein [Terrimonas sp. H1YJ31]
MKREHLIIPCCLLFIASLFLSVAVALKVITMGLVILAALINNPIRQKIHLLKERKAIWFMLAFAVLLFTSSFFSSNHHAASRFVQLRLPLVLFPLSIGLIQLSKDQRNKILLGIASIVTICCFISLCYSIFRYRQHHDTAWLYNDALSFLIGQQSIYTSLLVNMSIYIFAYHLLYSRLSGGYKFWLGFGIIFLFIISYLLASRNMMLILYASTIGFSFYYIFKKKKWLEGATLIMGMIIAGFLIFKFFPKTINRFKELAFTQFDYQSQAKESHYAGQLTSDQWNGANFRLAAWQCGWQIFKEHPIAGVGLGDKKDELFKVYEQKQFHFAIATNKNVHNNYLDILYSLGIIGFILFFAGWIFFPAIQFAQSKDGLALLILITFSLAMITENYFDRSLGALLVGFFVPFLISCKKPGIKARFR